MNIVKITKRNKTYYINKKTKKKNKIKKNT